MNSEQREQIQNSPPGALSFILTGFANPNNSADAALAEAIVSGPSPAVMNRRFLGLHAPDFFPTQVGFDYMLSPYLKELADFRNDFTVFSGLSYPEVGGGHNSEASFLTAAMRAESAALESLRQHASTFRDRDRPFRYEHWNVNGIARCLNCVTHDSSRYSARSEIKVTMQRNAFDKLNVALMLLLVLTSFRVGLSQSSNLIARFELPQRETIIRQSIERCADWLTAHSVSGYLEPSERADKKTMTAIAWKDPTLVPEQPNLLAGYLITDTLWASVALRDLRPPLAKELWTSLEGLGHASNGLHEVLWSKVDGIRHRSADLDRVHGASVGKLYLPNDQSVDLRVFNMQADPAYTVGHPKLFAEHAAYQALHEFWHGDVGRARDRIRRLFQCNLETASEQTIFWDNEQRILVDHVNIDEWREMKRSHSSCRIFAFKLAVVAYAAKVLNLEREFRSELVGIQQRLWECQLNDGGIAHFAKISTDGQLIACKDATGEATSITILCHTVQPTVQQ